MFRCSIVTSTGINRISVKVFHYIATKMSMVQVFAEDQLTLQAQLVGRDTIGDHLHLGLNFVCTYDHCEPLSLIG